MSRLKNPASPYKPGTIQHYLLTTGAAITSATQRSLRWIHQLYDTKDPVTSLTSIRPDDYMFNYTLYSYKQGGAPGCNDTGGYSPPVSA